MDKQLTLKPRLSEKAYAGSSQNVYVFDVNADANKHMIAGAVAKQFDVTVIDVNTTILKGKPKRTIRKGGRISKGRQSDVKKAYVTLKAGDSIAVFATENNTETSDKKESK